MTEEQLVATYPRLWHMAHDGAWPAIRDHGLKSAKAIIDTYVAEPAQRETLNSHRRPQSVQLQKVGFPPAVLRDQKPMSDKALLKCLRDGMSPRGWYELLNSRTFFWLSRDRIWRLLGARAYRGVSQTVLTLDTASLVAAHRDKIWLSPMNSGSTIQNALARGPDTFRRIADFPFAERAKTRARGGNVVELLVEEAVLDIADHVLAVHQCRKDEILQVIWKRPGAVPEDRP